MIFLFGVSTASNHLFPGVVFESSSGSGYVDGEGDLPQPDSKWPELMKAVYDGDVEKTDP
eukprot:2799841-Amphidinium_carterae.1